MYWQVFQVNVQPGRRADLLQISKAYVEECVREEPGTLAVTVLLDEQDEDRYPPPSSSTRTGRRSRPTPRVR